MAKKFSARRYAQALFAVAQKKNKADGMLVEALGYRQLTGDKAVAAYLVIRLSVLRKKSRYCQAVCRNIDPPSGLPCFSDGKRLGKSMLSAEADEYRKMVDDSKGN